jgi:hypothetical protein
MSNDKKEAICFCDCHAHPGTYFCEPCSICGHYDSQGMTTNYRSGWMKKVDKQPYSNETINRCIKLLKHTAFKIRDNSNISHYSDWRNLSYELDEMAEIFETYPDQKQPLATDQDELWNELFYGVRNRNYFTGKPEKFIEELKKQFTIQKR